MTVVVLLGHNSLSMIIRVDVHVKQADQRFAGGRPEIQAVNHRRIVLGTIHQI